VEAIQQTHQPLWKNQGLWIGVAVGAGVIIIAGGIGGYYGSRSAASDCTGTCASFR
jgi:hypothetical protein